MAKLPYDHITAFEPVITVGTIPHMLGETLKAITNAYPTVTSVRVKDALDVVNELGYTKASVSIAMKKLRENGYIAVDGEGNLTSMVERTQIERMPDGKIVFHDGGADDEPPF